MDLLPQLSHEKLIVYQKSIEFLSLSSKILANIPRGYAELSDQLKRAALSVPLNIAEASGRTGSLDNAKHFAIARGSALECGAILDVCFALRIIEAEIHSEATSVIFGCVDAFKPLQKTMRETAKAGARITMTEMAKSGAEDHDHG